MLLDKIEHAWVRTIGQMNMGFAKAAIILVCRVGHKGCLADMFDFFERNFGIIVADIDLGEFLRDFFQHFSIITKRNFTVQYPVSLSRSKMRQALRLVNSVSRDL